MTSGLNLWTGVRCQMLCNSLVDFECSDETAVNTISVSFSFIIIANLNFFFVIR